MLTIHLNVELAESIKKGAAGLGRGYPLRGEHNGAYGAIMTCTKPTPNLYRQVGVKREGTGGVRRFTLYTRE